MKLSFCILGMMLTCLFAVFMVGCDRDPDYVYVVSVDPPEDSTIKPGLYAIVVTFDGEPEGLKAFWSNPDSERTEATFELSGNTATFDPKRFGIESYPFSPNLLLTWENIDNEAYDHPAADLVISFRCASDAVITLSDNPDDVRILPPWPHLANFNSGSPNADSLRFEFPIYTDKVLAYDLPINLKARIQLIKYPGTNYSRTVDIPPLLSRMDFSCVIEKGSTESVCTIEIPIDGFKDWELESLVIDLADPLSGGQPPYIEGVPSRLGVFWQTSDE